MEKYFDNFCLVYAILIFPTYILIDVEFDKGISWSFKYLTIPTIGIVYLLFLDSDPGPYWYDSASTSGKRWWPLLVALILTAFHTTPVIWVNILIGDQQPLVVMGTIEEINEHQGLEYTSYSIEVRNQATNELTQLHITKKEYSTLVVGEEFKREMYKGSLGFLYRFKTYSKPILKFP